MESRKRRMNEAFEREDKKENTRPRLVVAFFGQADEEAPTTSSLFEEKYFEFCPPQLKLVGGLRSLIGELIDDSTDRKPNRILNDPVENFLTFMYLFLHFSAPPSSNEDHDATLNEEEKMRSRIADQATEKIRSCFRITESPNGKTIFDIPGGMGQIFVLELLQRLRMYSQSHLPVNKTHLEIIAAFVSADFIFNFDSDVIARGVEYIQPIYEICAEIIKMPQHKKLIPIALQVLASQWAICDHLIRQNREEIVNDPKRVELFERMPDIVYPLFLNVDEDIYRGVTTFFSALSRKQRFDGYFEKIEKMNLQRLSEQDAILLAVAPSILDNDEMNIQRTLKAIVRLKDSPLQLPFLVFLKEAILGGGLNNNESLLKRLVPILFVRAKLPERNKSLLEITAGQIIRLGITNFDTSKLPADLHDRLYTTINTENALKLLRSFENLAQLEGVKDKEEKEELTPRALSAACVDILCSVENPDLACRAAALVIPRLTPGFSENPDWRQREALILLTGAIAPGLSAYSQFHIEAVNSLLPHIIKGLEDPVSCIKEIACWAIGRWYVAIIKGGLEGHIKLPLPLKEVLQILLQLSFEADSLQDGRFIAGVSAITEFVEGFTEKMAPYFADILERAQLAVTNLKGRHLLLLLDMVTSMQNAAEDNDIPCPPHQIREAILTELEAYSEKEWDEESHNHVRNLLDGISAFETNQLAGFGARITSICDKVVAKELKREKLDPELGTIICELLCFVADNNELRVDEIYTEFVLRGLEEPAMYQTLFAFIGDVAPIASARFQPILPACFRTLVSQLTSENKIDANNAFYGLGGLFRVDELPEEQIVSFLSIASSAAGSVDRKMADTIGLAIGMCGTRHAQFMRDVEPMLLSYMLQQMTPESLRGRFRERQDFITGVLRIFEVLLERETDKLKNDQAFVPILLQVAMTFPSWQKIFPQVTPVLNGVTNILQNQSNTAFGIPQLEDILDS